MLIPVTRRTSSASSLADAAPSSNLIDLITDPYNQEADVFVTSLKPSPRNIPDFSKTEGRKF